MLVHASAYKRINKSNEKYFYRWCRRWMIPKNPLNVHWCEFKLYTQSHHCTRSVTRTYFADDVAMRVGRAQRRRSRQIACCVRWMIVAFPIFLPIEFQRFIIDELSIAVRVCAVNGNYQADGGACHKRSNCQWNEPTRRKKNVTKKRDWFFFRSLRMCPCHRYRFINKRNSFIGVGVGHYPSSCVIPFLYNFIVGAELDVLLLCPVPTDEKENVL